MRRRKRKNSKRKQQIISIVILVIMVLGFTLAGIIMRNPTQGQQQQANQQSGPQSLQYNGYEFTRQNNKYAAEINGQQRSFYYPPTSTLTIDTEAGWESLLQDGFTVTFDPNRADVQSAAVARYELVQHMPRVGSGVISQTPEYQSQVVTCDDATQNSPVLYLRQSNETSITVDGACVIVNGEGQETVRAAEHIIYELLGVIG